MIRQGDKCWVWLFIKKHYGICTGFVGGVPWFVHNTPDGGVVHTSLEGFAGRSPIHIEQRALAGQEAAVALRALKLVGHAYDLLNFNCEHAANLAANGVAESKQVKLAGAAAACLAAFSLLSLVNQNGTSVDRNGYRRDSGGRFGARLWW
jgi:hypothetical protein